MICLKIVYKHIYRNKLAIFSLFDKSTKHDQYEYFAESRCLVPNIPASYCDLGPNSINIFLREWVTTDGVWIGNGIY
jgi:hypothetical protein